MKLPPGHVPGQGVVKSSGFGGFGERLLRSMGWEEGQGLGKSGQGMREAIEVKKKEDTVGVGSKSNWNWEEKWWEKTFDSAAQSLLNKTSDSSDSSSSDSDSDNDDADDSMKRALQQSVVVQNRDGTISSASAEELKLLSSLSSKGGRLAAGRFGGRDAKIQRIREQEASFAAEAASKLGSHSAKITEKAAKPTKNSKKDESESEKSNSTSEAQFLSKKERKNWCTIAANGSDADAVNKEFTPKRQRIIIEPVIPSMHTSSLSEFVPTPASGWWGASLFKSAGSLESLQQQRKGKSGFDESEQERIYTTAHAGKAQGKVGLGQMTRTLKVGGVKFSGKKVVFSDDNDDIIEGNTGNVHAVEASAAAIATLSPLPSAAAATLKWEKIITKQLQGTSKNSLKLKKLSAAVHSVVQKKLRKGDKKSSSSTNLVSMTATTMTLEEVHSTVEKTVKNNSKKFSIERKVVKLLT